MDVARIWRQRPTGTLLKYNISLRREQEVQRRKLNRQDVVNRRRETFINENHLQESDVSSIIDTSESQDLEFWCANQSWSFCSKCLMLTARKLLPSFRNRSPTAVETKCKCGNGIYEVPNVDDVPLILRNLSEDDVRLLRPFVVHCGDYVRHVHGYRQRSGPFRVSWADVLVKERLRNIEDESRRETLLRVYRFLMNKADSSYSKFINMQRKRAENPFLYEIFSSEDYVGIECALWPTLYYKTILCESNIKGQTNRASGKMCFMHKVLSPVEDYAINFELLHYQYDRWLFKTITGAINASKFSGCSPNSALQEKSFSATFWRWQHLYLLDAVRQFGFASFFLTISPYEWTFPWPPFLDDLRDEFAKEPTDIPLSRLYTWLTSSNRSRVDI